MVERKLQRKWSNAAPMWCGLIPSWPLLPAGGQPTVTRQKGWKEEAWDWGSDWGPMCQGLCLMMAQMLNHLIFMITLQYEYHLHLHLTDKIEIWEAKQFPPNYAALNVRTWFPHQSESGGYNLSTCPYSSSWGRISHHIPAYNYFKEAAKKRVLSGWLFLVLGNGKSRGDRRIFIYIYGLMKSHG